MLEHPFSVFGPYRVRVRLYDRSDNVRSADDVEKLEGFPLADPQQVHGALTLRADGPGRFAGADGLVSATTNLTLNCRSADCQTLAFYSHKLHIGGVLHAGWKGLVAGAIPAFLDVLKREFDVQPSDLVVGIGPSLCLVCSEFTDPVRELPMIDPKFFHERLVDLRGIANKHLADAGIHSTNIERHPDCSKCRKDLWWSLRGGDLEELNKGARNVLSISLL